MKRAAVTIRARVGSTATQSAERGSLLSMLISPMKSPPLRRPNKDSVPAVDVTTILTSPSTRKNTSLDLDPMLTNRSPGAK